MKFYYSLMLTPIIFVTVFVISLTETDDGTFKRFEDLKEIDGIYSVNNVPYSGEVRVYYKDNNLLRKVELVNGMLDGKYEEYYENGNVFYTGKYIKGKKEGNFKTYREDNRLYESSWYKNGLKNGVERIYTNVDGTLTEEIEYKDGQKNGWEEQYTFDSKPSTRGFYVNGVANGRWEEYRLGYLGLEGDMLDGEQNGEWREYIPGTKNILTVSNYKKGVLHGKYIEYSMFSPGKITIVGFYDNGKKTGEWNSYYDDGQLKWKGTYIDGELNGKVKSYDSKDIFWETPYVNGKREGLSKKYFVKNGESILSEVTVYKNDMLNGTEISLLIFRDDNEVKPIVAVKTEFKDDEKIKSESYTFNGMGKIISIKYREYGSNSELINEYTEDCKRKCEGELYLED